MIVKWNLMIRRHSIFIVAQANMYVTLSYSTYSTYSCPGIGTGPLGGLPPGNQPWCTVLTP